MTKKDIKAIFRGKGVQCGGEAMDMVQDHIRREVTAMAQRCKDGNVKRLSAKLFWVAQRGWLENSSQK